MDELGYTTDLEDAPTFPIDVLKKTERDGNMINGGKNDEGYYNEVIKQMKPLLE